VAPTVCVNLKDGIVTERGYMKRGSIEQQPTVRSLLDSFSNSHDKSGTLERYDNVGMMCIREPSFESPDTRGVLRQRRLSDIVNGQALAKHAQSTAAASSAKRIYLRRELAAEVSHLHVDKREQILRGGVVDKREKLEAARVEVWNGCDLAADMNLGNYFLFSVVADCAEVVPTQTLTSNCE
jgi:hypothetical protein